MATRAGVGRRRRREARCSRASRRSSTRRGTSIRRQRRKASLSTWPVSESGAIAGWRGLPAGAGSRVRSPTFQSEVEWYSDEPVFLIELDLAPEASGQLDVEVNVRYGACDPRQCLPPKRKSASASLTIAQNAAAAGVRDPRRVPARGEKRPRGRPPSDTPSPESGPVAIPKRIRLLRHRACSPFRSSPLDSASLRS